MSAKTDRLLADPSTPIVGVTHAGKVHFVKRVAGAPTLCGIASPRDGWAMIDSWAPAPVCNTCPWLLTAPGGAS